MKCNSCINWYIAHLNGPIGLPAYGDTTSIINLMLCRRANINTLALGELLRYHSVCGQNKDLRKLRPVAFSGVYTVIKQALEVQLLAHGIIVLHHQLIEPPHSYDNAKKKKNTSHK